jgi:hypothetical protein
MRIRHRLTGHWGVAGLVLVLAGGSEVRAEMAQVLVESLSAPVQDIRESDYVTPGTTIDLGTSTTIVLEYLAICRREKITGGIVHVGAQSSWVKGGTISRTEADCSGRLQVDASQAVGGGPIYRGTPRNR